MGARAVKSKLEARTGKFNFAGQGRGLGPGIKARAGAQAECLGMGNTNYQAKDIVNVPIITIINSQI